MLRERDRGRNLLGERTLSKFGHLLRENRYLHSISMEKPRCPCTAVQRYLTQPSRLPGIAIFWLFQNSAAARPNSHSFQAATIDAYTRRRRCCCSWKPHRRVTPPCFSFQFSKVWKVSPLCGKGHLAIQDVKKWQRHAQLNSSSISTIPGLYAPPPFRH